MTSRIGIREAVLTRLWIAFPVGGIVPLVAYFTVLDRGGQDLIYNLFGLGSTAAIFLGVLLWRPAHPAGWLTIGAGVALECAGDIAATLLAGPDGSEPFPSPADALYLGGYILLVVGVVGLAQGGSRARNRAAWVDALIMATVASIFLWILVIRAGLAEPDPDPLASLIAVAYPFQDIVQVAVVTRLLLGSTRRSPALVLLGLAFLVSFLADIVYAGQVLDDTYGVGQLVDGGWLLAYLAWGAAALHPSMASRPDTDDLPRNGAVLTRARLAFLACGALTGPVVLILEGVRGEPIAVHAVIAVLSVLYILVLYRVVIGMDELRSALDERSRLAVVLREQATHDPLTGLANRRMFVERLDAALLLPRSGRPAAVLYLDLDRVKAINDSEGHAAGDEALAEVARRLRSGLRSADTVARVGGDEFAILLDDGQDDPAEVAARVNALLAEPVTVGGRSFRATASVGVAVAAPGESAHDLLRNADQAMYAAKGTGGHGYAVYSDAMRAEALARLGMEADLRDAVARGEFVLHYQPIVEMATGTIAGVEALVRWQHPTRGLLAPGQFIDLAEESGLIVPLGRWVIEEAVGQASAWRRDGLLRAPPMVEINVAARQLADPQFALQVAGAIAGTGMGAGRIAVELTETELFRDTEAVGRTLALLRKAGVRVVIDDFGTAYASMSYLVDFPVDGLKIDRSFVQRLTSRDGNGPAVVRSMISLAANLGILVVAEGVETEAQAAILREFGCTYAQGYLFSRPLPAAELSALLLAGVIATGRGDPAAHPVPILTPEDRW